MLSLTCLLLYSLERRPSLDMMHIRTSATPRKIVPTPSIKVEPRSKNVEQDSEWSRAQRMLYRIKWPTAALCMKSPISDNCLRIGSRWEFDSPPADCIGPINGKLSAADSARLCTSGCGKPCTNQASATVRVFLLTKSNNNECRKRVGMASQCTNFTCSAVCFKFTMTQDSLHSLPGAASGLCKPNFFASVS